MWATWHHAWLIAALSNWRAFPHPLLGSGDICCSYWLSCFHTSFLCLVSPHLMRLLVKMAMKKRKHMTQDPPTTCPQHRPMGEPTTQRGRSTEPHSGGARVQGLQPPGTVSAGTDKGTDDTPFQGSPPNGWPPSTPSCLYVFRCPSHASGQEGWREWPAFARDIEN